MTQHEQIVAAYESYLAENEKFTAKGVKAAAARARKALHQRTPQRNHSRKRSPGHCCQVTQCFRGL